MIKMQMMGNLLGIVPNENTFLHLKKHIYSPRASLQYYSTFRILCVL